MKLLIIGMGGFVGAILRYTVSGWSYRIIGSDLPHGTLVVNVAGSFILGFFMALVQTKIVVSDVSQFLAIGLLGAFTTFSTFSYETLSLAQEGLFRQAALNILLNVVLALIAVWGGDFLGKTI